MGVFHGLVDRPAATLEQGIEQLLELGPGEGHLQVFRTRGVGRDEGQIDVARLRRAEFLLGLFAGLLQPLQGHRVLAEVDALFLLELVGHVIDQHFVEVVAAEVGVAVGADDAEHAVGHFQHGNVERAAAEVEDHDLLGLLLVQTIGQRRGRRLVDDSGDFQAGYLAGVLGGLALGIVEVGRHGDHGLVHLVAQIGFGRFLELAQDQRRDFRRRVLLVAGLDLHVVLRSADDLVGNDLLFAGHFVVPAAHEPLDRKDRAARVSDRLALGRLADQRLALVGKRHHARRQPVALLVGNDLGLFAFHNSHDRVGGSQIDPDDFFTLSHS